MDIGCIDFNLTRNLLSSLFDLLVCSFPLHLAFKRHDHSVKHSFEISRMIGIDAHGEFLEKAATQVETINICHLCCRYSSHNILSVDHINYAMTLTCALPICMAQHFVDEIGNDIALDVIQGRRIEDVKRHFHVHSWMIHPCITLSEYRFLLHQRSVGPHMRSMHIFSNSREIKKTHDITVFMMWFVWKPMPFGILTLYTHRYVMRIWYVMLASHAHSQTNPIETYEMG